jgi:hypothetical protein
MLDKHKSLSLIMAHYYPDYDENHLGLGYLDTFQTASYDCNCNHKADIPVFACSYAIDFPPG